MVREQQYSSPRPPSAGLFSFPIDVLSVPDKEDDKCAILEVTDDPVVPHAKAILANAGTHERLSELEWGLLRAVPVELPDQSLLHVPRELFQCAKGTGREDVAHAASELEEALDPPGSISLPILPGGRDGLKVRGAAARCEILKE